MSGETYEVSITAKMDMESIEQFYADISTKFESIVIKPSIEDSVLSQLNAFGANLMTNITGFADLFGMFNKKSASKEIEEVSKKCQDTYKTIGKYRDILLGVATAFETTGKNARNAKQDLNRISDTYRAMGTHIGKGLNEGIKDTFKNLEKTMKDLGKTIEDTFKDKEKIQSPSKVFKQYGEYITEGLVDGIKDGSDDVTDTMKGLGDDMESSFGEKALSFGGGFALAAGVLGTIVEMFSNLMSTNEEFGAAVDAVWTQITEAFAPVTEAVMNLITSLGEEGMGGSFSWFSDALTGVSELAVSVIGTIGEFWAEHGEAIMLSVGEIWDFVSEILGGAIDFVGGVFEVISGIFSGNAEDIQSGMANLWEGIQDIFAPVVGFFAGIWERIKESFGTIGQTVAVPY